jgi:predicted membrane GTPase involved in stress response
VESRKSIENGRRGNFVGGCVRRTNATNKIRTSESFGIGLRPLVVINKVDKPNCRPDEVHDQVFDLFFNLDATEEQLDFPTFYGSSKQGWFNTSLEQTEDILPLLDGILQYVPAPKVQKVTFRCRLLLWIILLS